MSFLSSSLPNPTKKRRQIFVAYPYKLYDKRDYRRVYTDIGKAFKIEFVFADEKITDLHILQKIHNYIRESSFSIYDISGWNPNVTLELGIGLGLNERSYIAYNPEKTPVEDVPSDLRGVDRIQYTSFSGLEDSITKLVSQEYSIDKKHDMEDQIEILRNNAIKLVSSSEGLKIGDIAEGLGITIDLAKVVAKPLIGDQIAMRGVKKGAKYFPSSAVSQ
jgi:hypothetical protein